MKTSKEKSIVAAIAVALAVVVGGGAFCQVAETPEEGGGIAKAGGAAEAEKIAAAIRGCMKSYMVPPGFREERDGDDIWLRGVSGNYPSVFSRFDLSICIDGESREASCFAHLPTIVPEEKRAEMVEFLMRANVEYGISPASLVLESDNEVRCQAWMPFEYFSAEPELAAKRLVGAVFDKLYAASMMVAQIETGAAGADVASRVRPVGLFWSVNIADANPASEDVELVLAKCFADNEWTKGCADLEWTATLLGDEGEGDWDFIKASLSGLKEFFGGPYDEFHYTLVVKNGFVWDVCPWPVDMPKEAIPAVADAAMRINEVLKNALFFVDYDTGRLWCQYAIPVALLDDASEGMYDLKLKTMAAMNLARHGANLTGVAKSAESSGDAQAEEDEAEAESDAAEAADDEAAAEAALPELVEPPVKLPLLTKMLDAYDCWEAERWNMSRTNSLAVATRLRIAARKYMKYCVAGNDGADDGDETGKIASWPFDVEAFEADLMGKMGRDEYGLYCVKGEFNDYGEGTTEDGYVAINPSFRWVNRKMEEWATNVLDVAYRRLANDEAVKMLGAGCVNAGTFCWNIGTNEYFVIQRIDEDYRFEARDYIFMRWNGTDAPLIAATFNSMPTPDAMVSVRACIAGNSVGRNNLAALMWNKVADRGEADCDVIRCLLDAAKSAGVPEARENLNLVMDDE